MDDCMSLSCHVRVSELIYTLKLPEYQGTPYWSKQACIWSLSDCSVIRTHNHLVREQTFDHLAKLASDGCKINGCKIMGGPLSAVFSDIYMTMTHSKEVEPTKL